MLSLTFCSRLRVQKLASFQSTETGFISDDAQREDAELLLKNMHASLEFVLNNLPIKNMSLGPQYHLCDSHRVSPHYFPVWAHPRFLV